MRIARDGTWYHDGAPIRRPAMVRLFSTVLRREPDGRHVLVTPVEKLEIDVEFDRLPGDRDDHRGRGRGRTIALKLDSGDALWSGPITRCAWSRTSGLSPRVPVRHGLEAELSRAGLLRACRNRARRRRATRRACGAAASSSRWPANEPCRAPQRDACRARLRAAAGRRRDRAPLTALGRRPRCWSHLPTGRTRASSLPSAASNCAPMPARSPSPAAASTPARIRSQAALREAQEELDLEPAASRGRRPARPLSDDHRLSRDPCARGRPARPCAQPPRPRSRRLVRSAARVTCSIQPTSGWRRQ